MTSLDEMEKPKQKSRLICCAPGCGSRASDDRIEFHTLPKPNQRPVYITDFFGNLEKMDQLTAWARALELKKISSSARVCALHFTKNDYIFPDLEYKRKRLKKNAIPSQNLPKMKTKKFEMGKNREERLLGRISQKAMRMEKLETPKEESEEDQSTLLTENSTQILEQPQVQENTVDPIKYEIEVQEETDFMEPRFLSFITDDIELSTMTGIESFHILETIVNIVTDTFGDQLRHHNSEMSIHDEIILTYVKLKQNLSFSCLAALFQCNHAEQCHHVFQEMIIILSECLKGSIQWPSREQNSRNLPKCFEEFEDTRVVIGCTEIFTQHPKNLCCQLITHSSCKKSQTVKFMTGVTPSGNICYISKAYGGRASDKAIFERSDIIKLLERGDGVMADRRFTIDEICAKNGWMCHRPPFLREKRHFSKEEALYTWKIAKARAHIERSNQRIKIFKILGDRMSCKLIPYVEHIFTVICATINLGSSILKNEKYMDDE